MLSVFIAITLVVFMDGLISGVVDSMARNFTKNETGQVNVTTTEYRQRERFMPASAALRDSDAVVSAISEHSRAVGSAGAGDPAGADGGCPVFRVRHEGCPVHRR